MSLSFKKNCQTFFLLVGLLGTFTTYAQQWNSTSKADFNKLIVFGRATVELVADDSQEIRVNASGLDKDQVKVSFSGGECTIKINNLLKKEDNFNVKIEVGYSQLGFISVGGGASIFSNEILDVAMTEIKVLTGGIFECELAGRNLSIDLGQGAKAKLSGAIDYLNAQANTGGFLEAESLDVNNAEIKCNTGSIMELGYIQNIKGKASTGGKVYYKGTPESFDVKTSLGGEISNQH